VRLPLVLDDVLVNFDSQRAKAAAMVLRDFAATGHQLLVFTCHEHVAKLFKSLKATTCRLPSNVESGARLLREATLETQEAPPPAPILLPAPVKIEVAAPPVVFVAPPAPPVEVKTSEPAVEATTVERPRKSAPKSEPKPAKSPRPAREPIESMPLRAHRRRRSEPFANAIWHEPVVDDDLLDDFWFSAPDASRDAIESYDDFSFAGEREDVEVA
jgi:hypothetical protein